MRYFSRNIVFIAMLLAGIILAKGSLEQNMVNARNSFAFDLFKQIVSNDTSENIIISPFSANIALYMAVNGAKGSTKDQILQIIKSDDMITENKYNASRIRNYAAEGTVVRTANSIWIDEQCKLQTEYRKKMLEYYKAELNAVDFSQKKTLDEINDWVNDKTVGEITNLLDEIPADAVMFLINTVLFNGTWQTSFDPDHTRNEKFYLSNGKQTEVAMMHRTADIRTYSNQLLDAVSLDMEENADYSICLIMPHEETDIIKFASELSLDDFTIIRDKMYDEKLSIGIPKFDLSHKLLLNDYLKQMGINDAFSPQKADFGQMIDSDQSLFINRFLQETSIIIDENGARAASASVIEFSKGPGPKHLVFNRPFIFHIYEKRTGLILFSGMITNPLS